MKKNHLHSRRHFCYHKPLGSHSLGALLFFFPEAEACWTLRKLRRSERRRERNDLSLRPPPARAPPFPPFDQRFWPWDAHDFHGMAIMAVAISRNTRRYQKAAAWAYKLVDACTSFYNLFIFIQPSSEKAVLPTKSKPLRWAHITSTRFVLADPYPTSLHSRMWSLCALA